MSVAVARIRGAENEYTVVAASSHNPNNVGIGLGRRPSTISIGHIMEPGVPIIVKPGFNVILRELGPEVLRTIAAIEVHRTPNIGMLINPERIIDLKPDAYVVVNGLIALGFLDIYELRDKRAIFDRTDFTTGEYGEY